MYPERLGISEKSYFPTKNTFGSSANTAIGFVQKNYSILMHAQEFYEINIILKGEGMHYIGEGRLPACAGDVFIIPPEFMHGYVGGEGFDVYHLLLSPKFFDRYSADLHTLPGFSTLFMVEPAMRGRFSSKLYLRLDAGEIAELTLILDAISETKAEWRVMRAGYTLAVIARLCAKFGEKSGSEGSDEAFMKSMAHIYENYMNKITVEELARIAEMSRSAFISRFKAFTGHTPGEFILRHRVESAAGMLLTTSRTVNEIAASAGFYDTSHMVRCFEKVKGMSPTEYRRGRDL